MGRRIELDSGGTTRREQTGYGPQSRDQQTVYVEFTRAKVTNTIFNSSAKNELNKIRARISERTGTYDEFVEAVPLLRGMADQPIEGDVVLLCDFGGVDYYLGPLNTKNNVQLNNDAKKDPPSVPIGVATYEDATNAGYRWDVPFKNLNHKGKLSYEKLDYPNGKSYPSDTTQTGDLLLEGRMGNQLRLGARGAGPYTVLSNGTTENNITQESKFTSTSILSMTNNGTLEDYLGLVADQTVAELKLSVDEEDNARRTDIDYNYTGPQMYIGSNRIVFDTTSDNILLSSATTLDFNSLQNINLSTPKSVVIDSQDIYLGKEAIEDGQPVVLGVELFEVLSELLALLSSAGVAAPAPQPLQVLAPAPVNPAPGSSQPATPTIVGPLGTAVSNISNRLSKILSGNVFIKQNEG